MGGVMVAAILALLAIVTPAAAAATQQPAAPAAMNEDLVFRTQTNWQELPRGGVLRPFFDRYVRVFGVYIFASARVEPWALQHAARVMAKFLDQDEDGQADEPAVVEAMVARRAMQALLVDEEEWETGIGVLANDPDLSDGVVKNDLPSWDCSVDDVWVLAELFQSGEHAATACERRSALGSVFRMTRVALRCRDGDLRLRRALVPALRGRAALRPE